MMKLSISQTSNEMGIKAAGRAAELIGKAVSERGEARILVSTGQSQFEFFDALIKMDIPWDKVEIFHLDEYVGLALTHEASFCRYLKYRFIDKIGSTGMNYISGEGDTKKTIADMTARIRIVAMKYVPRNFLSMNMSSTFSLNTEVIFDNIFLGLNFLIIFL